MEDRLVKIAIRRILGTLAWVGLLVGHRAWAQSSEDWATPRPTREARAEGGPAQGRAADKMPDSSASVIGETQMPIGGIFGDTPPAACEFCGGGGCLPPIWSAETTVGAIGMSRASNLRLGANSLPAGPLSAGTITVTNSNGITNSNNFIQYLNDAVQISALEVHTPGIIVSPAFGLQISRFLGRDAEGRDHFIDFEFNGLQNYSQLPDTVHGSIIPFYNTTPLTQTIPAPTPVALYFMGSLVSPAPIYLPINGNQQQLIAPSFSILGENYDKAFNRSTTMSTDYTTSYNEWELNYRFVGHNQPDQMVLNPNGQWYRQCQNGYYHSYFFGAKAVVIDENFNFFSSGSQFAAVNGNTQGALQYNHQGTYGVHTYNTLLGLQTGGKLEYRLCRWTFDAHGNAGMFLNFARQDSRIQTSFGGPDLPTLSDGSVVQNTDSAFSATSNVVAFAGGFGVGGSYKFRPNLIGHIAYDLQWIGDIARAPEQVNFNSVPESTRDLINTKGSVFYNGVNFGAEFDW
jgi:hypothetical protein